MPTKEKTATKPPLDPHLKKVTFSLPAALVAKIDAYAKETGITRATLINKILLECTSPDSARVPKAPGPCPRGHIRPCERNQPPVSPS
jgi:hypothetical protein